jgi:hypothetical protein
MDGVKTFSLVAALALLLTGCTGGGFVHEGVAEDRQPPQIRQVRITPSNLVYVGKQVRVEAEVTDEGSGVKSVTAEIKYPDETLRTVDLTLQGNVFVGDFNAQWDVNRMPADVSRWFMAVVIRAEDNSGNIARSPESSVRVAISPPGLPPEL